MLSLPRITFRAMTGGLPSSTLRSSAIEWIIPALQGASFSDGQMKDGTKGVVIDNVDKGSAAGGLPSSTLRSSAIE
jgi:hypothetical protein